MANCPTEAVTTQAIDAAVIDAIATDAGACPTLGGGGPFAANAVQLDGTDYGRRATALSGVAASKQAIFSAWVKFDDNALRFLMGTDSGFNTIERSSDFKLQFTFHRPAGGLGLRMKSLTSYTSSASFVHILASWDQGAALSHLYVNDVSDKSLLTQVNENLRFDNAVYRVCSDGGWPGQELIGCISEYYWNPGEYLDFSVEANRRLFIDASGKPVSLGADGSTPTTNQPAVYLNGNDTTFFTNLGSGGAITQIGTLTNCASNPSD